MQGYGNEKLSKLLQPLYISVPVYNYYIHVLLPTYVLNLITTVRSVYCYVVVNTSAVTTQAYWDRWIEDCQFSTTCCITSQSLDLKLGKINFFAVIVALIPWSDSDSHGDCLWIISYVIVPIFLIDRLHDCLGPLSTFWFTYGMIMLLIIVTQFSI